MKSSIDLLIYLNAHHHIIEADDLENQIAGGVMMVSSTLSALYVRHFGVLNYEIFERLSIIEENENEEQQN